MSERTCFDCGKRYEGKGIEHLCSSCKKARVETKPSQQQAYIERIARLENSFVGKLAKVGAFLFMCAFFTPLAVTLLGVLLGGI